MRQLTLKQTRLLMLLESGPLRTQSLVKASGVSRAGVPLTTYDSVHSSMRALEDRELVRRVEDNPIQWQLTAKGRKALPTYDEAHGHGIGPSAEYDDIEC